jgi:hypothetical protein
MAKKMKRFDNGGYTGDDPIVKYRMGMIDAKGNDLTKKVSEPTVEPKVETETTQGQNRMIDDATRERAMASLTSKSDSSTPATPKATKSTVKAVEKAAAKTEEKEEAPTKKTSVQEARETIAPKSMSMPKSFKEAGGNTKAAKSTAKMPSMSVNLPDPLSGFDSKGKRYSGRDTDDRRKGGAIKMASGGKVSSASSRADGCAVKGKTRGRMV